MGLFDSFGISGAIATVQSTRPGSAEGARAEQRVLAAGKVAVPRLIEALSQDHTGRLAGLFARLVNNVNLPDIVRLGLMSEEPRVADAARHALMEASQLDPNRLLELYTGRGGAVVDIADLLLTRKQSVNAKSALRLLEIAHEEAQPILFKLIDQIATESMASTLIGFLKNAEWEGRRHIACTLARFPGDATRNALVRLLSDPHKRVREAALDAVAALGMRIPMQKVCALLRDPDLQVQAHAIETAIKLNDPDAVRHLIEILQDESEHARRAAVEVLNAVGDTNAIKDLLHALKDKDWWVRSRAADALGAIGGPKVIDAVLQLLGDPDEFMRRTAVEILNTTKDERAFRHLVTALKDNDWWVRERAIDALANIGDRRAVPHLTELLSEDNQATAVAVRALGQLGDPTAIDSVLAKLGSTDSSIQHEAVEALGALAMSDRAETIVLELARMTALSADIRDMAASLSAELQTRFRLGGRARRPVSAPGATPKSGRSLPSGQQVLPHASTVVEHTAPTLELEPGKSPSAPEAVLKTTVLARHAATSGEHVGNLASLQPGEMLGGRYKIVREVGRGGFGIVLAVEDQMVGEEIALKLISPQLVQDESAISRFMREVRYARRIAHENVIRVYDFVTAGDFFAISMEFFASHPLARRIRRGLHRRPAEGLKLIRDIASGMQVAHQADIVHRDLKPANILVNDNDLLKIVDFGLAAACSQEDARVTKTGLLVGTPTYMAPEQGRGLPVDARTDIYSLGVIMYEIFTGTPPYAADNPLSVLYQHIEGVKEAPSKRNPAILREIEALILKAMALKPDDRYQSAQALLDDLAPLELKDAA